MGKHIFIPHLEIIPCFCILTVVQPCNCFLSFKLLMYKLLSLPLLFCLLLTQRQFHLLVLENDSSESKRCTCIFKK